MLTELRVTDLGVIADLCLVLGPGMTALTGETGAGKTLVVEAIELLVGARAEGVLVRPGAVEARVDARFLGGGGVPSDDASESVVTRTVPAEGGRSRAYVDGRMVPATALAALAAGRVDLHGQHSHQSLLGPAAQRAALDAFAGIDTAPLAEARAAARRIGEALADLGGDSRARAREVDLLRFQVAELEAAALHDPDEEESLAAEEDRLADATAHRHAAGAARDALDAEGAASDSLGAAVALLTGRPPLADLHSRLRAAAAEVQEAASDLRVAAESLEDDPERLADVRARRQLLRELRRKYGETLAEVMAYVDQARARLVELESHEERVSELEGEAAQARSAVEAVAARLGADRRRAGPALAATIQANLRTLAMPACRFEVVVGEADPGDEVTFLLGANPGEPALPLARVASGGELARTMLAVRLALTDATRAGPAPDRPSGVRSTLVFDEVDAGIGGEAAVAVGRALAALADHHQVLVVTHLPQVAAFAHSQVAVVKEARGGRTVARAEVLDEAGRVIELSRMLSGQPGSATARHHARELLAEVAASRLAPSGERVP